MIIAGRRIRRLDKHFGPNVKGTQVVIGLSDLSRFQNKLRRLGFTASLAAGETVLPAPVFGPVSKFNAEGAEIVHRDQRMETCYRLVEWHWKEWRGRYDQVERSKFVDVPYKRYPRTFVPPPAIEFTLTLAAKGDSIVATRPRLFNPRNQKTLLHIINLFLEIFGECSIFTARLEQIFRAPVRRLNWHILPPGEMPWDRLQTHVQPIIAEAPKGNQPLIRNRLETINDHKPQFVAVGRAGFKGYIIFGFPKKKLFVLESIYYGNATYVFNRDWQRLSQMTKAEILDQNLQQDRLIHREVWYKKIKKVLK